MKRRSEKPKKTFKIFFVAGCLLLRKTVKLNN